MRTCSSALISAETTKTSLTAWGISPICGVARRHHLFDDLLPFFFAQSKFSQGFIEARAAK